MSEAGASVYSITDGAKRADPTLDVGALGAASLARRLQDPLAELVKIDPKAVGVGMYQHDVAQKVLESELDSAVESAVCRVGAVNTASVPLLRRVPGLNVARAEAIVQARPAEGYVSRSALLAVKGVGPKSYEQAAGFRACRATRRAGGELLDCTAVHPESYPAARRLLARLGASADALTSTKGRAELAAAASAAVASASARSDLAASCGVGERTLVQIADALGGAERDARDSLPGPLLLGTQLRALEDMQVGQRMQGVVRNVTPFGCFVNVGLKEDGLLHVSKMGPLAAAAGRGGDESAAAFVGQPLGVIVLSVDLQRRRLSLGLDRECSDGGSACSSAAKRGSSGDQESSNVKRKRT